MTSSTGMAMMVALAAACIGTPVLASPAPAWPAAASPNGDAARPEDGMPMGSAHENSASAPAPPPRPSGHGLAIGGMVLTSIGISFVGAGLVGVLLIGVVGDSDDFGDPLAFGAYGPIIGGGVLILIDAPMWGVGNARQAPDPPATAPVAISFGPGSAGVTLSF